MSGTIMAQTFPGQGGLLIPPGAPGQTVGITTSIATVSGVGIIGDGCTIIENVTMDIVHTFVGDIAIFLISPDGQVLELSSGNGGGGDNFTNTVFTDFTTPFITAGTPPFNGIFRPEGRQQNTIPPFLNGNPLGTFTFDNTFSGINADGDWTLLINDYVIIDVGVLNSWSITFTSGGGPPPTVDLGPDVSICPGQTVTLTAAVTPGADMYQWNSGQTTQSISVSPVTTTTYIVTVTNNGCLDQDTVIVVVDPNSVTAQAGPDVSLCQGESTLLTGSGGSGGAMYDWSTGETTPSISVTPANTTTYTLTVTDGGCSATDQVTVTISALPVADAGPPVTICEGESINLTASGGTQNNQYIWSTGESGPVISVDPLVTTTYTVTVTINGCEDEDEVEVTVEPAPEVDAGPDMTICLGESADLEASGSGGLYSWSTGEFGEEITVTPATTTTYIITLSENGCDATDDVEVEVVNVIAVVSPDQTICDGDIITLTASGGDTYEWNTGQTTSSISVSPGNTTEFSVTVSDGICEDIATIEIEVFPLPVAQISPPQTICSGESINLSASGGTDFDWSTGQSGPDIQVSPVTTTTYTVTVSNGNCSETATVIVTVNPTPNLSAGPDIIICDGASATIVATGLIGVGEYTWNTGDAGPSITVTPAITTTYTVTATHFSGCFDTDEVLVIVNPVPTASAGPDVFIQSGNSATLTATGGGTYVWSTGAITSSINVMPAMTTTYSVTVTVNGCTDVAEVTVFVDEIPLVNLGQDLTVCEGENITLNASITAPFIFEYLWSTNDQTPVLNVLILSDTMFSVTVTEPVSGIMSVDTISIGVIPLVSGTINIPGAPVVCDGDTVMYTIAPVPGATSYQWVTSLDGTILSGQGSPTVEVIWNGVGTQQVEVTASNICNSISGLLSLDIQVPPAMPGGITGVLDPCESSLETYFAFGTLDPEGYEWTVSTGGTILSGQGTNQIEVQWNSQGTGSICVVALNDCGPSAPFCVDVTFTSFPFVFSGNDTIVCGLQADLHGSGSGTWILVQGPGSVVFTDESDPQSGISVSTPGLYEFAFTNSINGCDAEDRVAISFLSEPNITNLQENCAADLLTYTVTFQIQDGQGPYSVLAGIVSGQDFISNPIDAGVGYVFQVEDVNGCFSPAVSGQQECACITQAGTMDTDVLEACADQSVFASYLGGEQLGPEDTLAFILHDGNIPDGIIAVSFAPEFLYVAGMTFGQTYFISAIVGKKDVNHFPSLSDPCLAISNGTPVIFHALPLANMISMDTIPCDPAVLDISIGQSSSGPQFQYSWVASAGGMILNGADSSVMSAGSPGIYVLEVVEALTGCSASDTILVTSAQFDTDAIQIETTLPVCPGDCNGSILFVDPASHWSFDFGDGMLVSAPNSDSLCPGSIVVRVVDKNGCSATEEVVLPEPNPVEVDLGPDQNILQGESIVLEAKSESTVVFYNWGSVDPCTICSDISVQPVESALYQVIITDERGCLASDEIWINVLPSKEIYLPNVFSPNGDMINDQIGIPDQAAIAGIHEFRIFDRWGNLVFLAPDHLSGSEEGKWDGAFKGKPMNPGVFTCTAEINFTDGSSTTVVWDVTLVR